MYDHADMPLIEDPTSVMQTDGQTNEIMVQESHMRTVRRI